MSPASGSPHLPVEVYARAERLLPWHADKLIFRATVEPLRLDGGDRCWYRVATPDGPEFVLVAAAEGTRRPAFDHARLAAALAAASGTPVEAARLPFERIELEPGREVRFDFGGARWRCGLAEYQCGRVDDPTGPTHEEVRSPDGRWAAFVREHNLWLREVATGAERALTLDGEAGNGYAGALRSPLIPAGLGGGREGDPQPAVVWSPDGRRLVSHRLDERGAGQLHLVQSTPLDGSLRPRLFSYTYPLPGDDPVPTGELLVFRVEGGDPVRLEVEPLPVLYYGSPLIDPIGGAATARWVWWSAAGERVYVLRRERGFRGYTLYECHAATGAARVLVRERAATGVDPGAASRGHPNVRILGDGREVLWYSQRDGWSHLYLYDAGSGELRRQVTAGSWNVVGLEHVDEAARQVYFTGVGREAGDPYLHRLYRVGLDGGEPELLTPEDADHCVSFAPSGRYFVDTYSRVDTPPATLLRAADGGIVCELERADIEPLRATGWRPPERFRAKAREGMTDVYGVLFRPTALVPGTKLPVLDYIYGGPQVNQAPASFADLARGRSAGFWQAQALAELGFAVVMIDGLGMPERGKAYHDVSYGNVADGGIPDHIAALRQLAERYPELDLERVGIFGHSAGGYASARAILAYPDFYKVAVSSAGLHHHRWDEAIWNERYMGPYGPHYEEQANTKLAANLKGKLLLVHGEMDENVHPFNTLRLVDALIKANKDFELLILPNRQHACFGDPYLVRRRWDYFVRHLLGVEPPEYRIKEP